MDDAISVVKLVLSDRGTRLEREHIAVRRDAMNYTKAGWCEETYVLCFQRFAPTNITAHEYLSLKIATVW